MKTQDELIDTIAAFIGARLQHPNPLCNGSNPLVSTIIVDQYKEKFSAVRIYCTLAHPVNVAAKWLATGRSTPEAPTYDKQFFNDCLTRDAWHYRRCYMDMVELKPELRAAICGQANYTELLFDTVTEVDALLDKRIAEDVESPHYLQNLYRHYGFENVYTLRAWFHTVYDDRAAFKAQINEHNLPSSV